MMRYLHLSGLVATFILAILTIPTIATEDTNDTESTLDISTSDTSTKAPLRTPSRPSDPMHPILTAVRTHALALTFTPTLTAIEICFTPSAWQTLHHHLHTIPETPPADPGAYLELEGGEMKAFKGVVADVHLARILRAYKSEGREGFMERMEGARGEGVEECEGEWPLRGGVVDGEVRGQRVVVDVKPEVWDRFKFPTRAEEA